MSGEKIRMERVDAAEAVVKCSCCSAVLSQPTADGIAVRGFLVCSDCRAATARAAQAEAEVTRLRALADDPTTNPYWRLRAERAEAAIERVRELAERAARLGEIVHPADLLAALDELCICGTPSTGNFDGPHRDCPVHGESPDVQLPAEERSEEATKKVVLIVDKYFSKCSACNGNADPSERQHIHGGPGSGYRAGSGLADTNGCGATFTERYYVADCRTEPVPVDGEERK